MSQFVPVRYETHGTKKWLHFNSYEFSAREAVIPLAAQELSHAVMSLPVGFVPQGDGFIPVAILGLTPGENLLVGANGQWLGRYIPAVFRCHPFHLMNRADGQIVLYVREDSGLVVDGPNGEPFFDENANAAKSTNDILALLQHVHQGRLVAQRMCQALEKHGLIQPWAINVQTPEGNQRIDGIYRIDEAKLNGLDPAAVAELHAAGALPLAYCQLLSMQHLAALGQLATARLQTQQQQQELPITPSGELNLDFLTRDGLIDFSGLS